MLELRSPDSQIHAATFAHTAATSSKTPLLINARLMIPIADAAADAVNSFAYQTEISGADKAAVAIAVNDPIYWDDAAKVFTNSSNAGANTLCGYALEAAAAGDATTGLIAFNSYAA